MENSEVRCPHRVTFRIISLQQMVEKKINYLFMPLEKKSISQKGLLYLYKIFYSYISCNSWFNVHMKLNILYTYIKMIHYKSFNVILLIYKLSTSSTNCQLTHIHNCQIISTSFHIILHSKKN
jgi:hypothetical protein